MNFTPAQLRRLADIMESNDDQPGFDFASAVAAMEAEDITATCKHCGRTITQENGAWVDPNATGDDAVWRETCDSHDTRAAEHEPSENSEDAPDRHGNRVRQEGVDRCACGSKYWENDRCIDCGATEPKENT